MCGQQRACPLPVMQCTSPVSKCKTMRAQHVRPTPWQVDKLHFVVKVKQLPTEEARNAELAVYRRRPDEAEAILIQVRASGV